MKIDDIDRFDVEREWDEEDEKKPAPDDEPEDGMSDEDLLESALGL